jgi:hypothetical protein
MSDTAEQWIEAIGQAAETGDETLGALCVRLETALATGEIAADEGTRGALAAALMARYLHLDAAQRGAVVWVLGKFHRPELRGFFERVLREELAGEGAVLWQALVALDNLEPGILRENGGGSILDVERNRVIARERLERIAE